MAAVIGLGAQAMGPDHWTNRSTGYKSRLGGPIGAQAMSPEQVDQ